MVDPFDETISEAGQQGEIYIRGPCLMTGYYNNPHATADTFKDGWLKTGDVGMIDEGGRVFIVDRRKDLIKGACIQPLHTTHVLTWGLCSPRLASFSRRAGGSLTHTPQDLGRGGHWGPPRQFGGSQGSRYT